MQTATLCRAHPRAGCAAAQGEDAKITKKSLCSSWLRGLLLN